MQGRKKTPDQAPDEGLIQSIRARFPVTEKWVGKTVFTRMLSKHLSVLDKMPKTLNKSFIRDMLQFVREYPSMMKFPQIDNLMAFENAIYTIIHGPDNMPLDYVNMARAITESTDSIVFHPPKGSVLLSCDFPIIDIYLAMIKGKSIHKAKFQKPRSYKVLVWKEEENMRYEYLKDDEFRLLDMLQLSRPFLSIYGEYSECRSCTDINELLPELCKKGYINRYSLP